MANMVKKGGNTVKAHLKHLRDHGQADLLKQALDFLKNYPAAGAWQLDEPGPAVHSGCGAGRPRAGCPGSGETSFGGKEVIPGAGTFTAAASQLRQWPVQLHLVSPLAAYFKNADVVLAADCAAYAYGGFHDEFLKGKSLAIACPKLDDGRDIYIEKIKSLIDDALINTLTVVTMEVPCCSGLVGMVQAALSGSRRKVPVKHVVISIQGDVNSSVWL